MQAQFKSKTTSSNVAFLTQCLNCICHKIEAYCPNAISLNQFILLYVLVFPYLPLVKFFYSYCHLCLSLSFILSLIVLFLLLQSKFYHLQMSGESDNRICAINLPLPVFNSVNHIFDFFL